MGAECSSDVKERPKPQFSALQRHLPVTSVMPSPLVSSFKSCISPHHRGRYRDSFTMDEVAASHETGYSDSRSFSGYVPLKTVMRWLEGLSPPLGHLSPVPDPDVWSDGVRENKDWIRTEGDHIDPAQERWDAPHYVSAIGLRSPCEKTPVMGDRKRHPKTRANALCQ